MEAISGGITGAVYTPVRTANRNEETGAGWETEANQEIMAGQETKANPESKTGQGIPASEGDSPKPARDVYIPEKKNEKKAKAAEGKKPETCTGSTDKVDREIEKLKKKKEELEQRLLSETDEGRIRELERQLEQVNRELSEKDNDAYRRQHMEITA